MQLTLRFDRAYQKPPAGRIKLGTRRLPARIQKQGAAAGAYRVRRKQGRTACLQLGGTRHREGTGLRRREESGGDIA